MTSTNNCNNNNNISNGGFNSFTEMTLTDLQEMAIRQQKQIEINQQLLLAKEKRLKMLKLEEQKNQQLSMLSQSNFHMPSGFSNANTLENTQKLENLKQNVLGQELKIFKLKQLRNQILEYKLSNSNMYSELDLIKSLFTEKERELVKAVSKVSELTKQIEQLRKIKNLSSSQKNQQNGTNGSPVSPNMANLNNPTNNLNVTELDKLKQELQIRNKLNEQQSLKIIQQHEQFNKKQLEVMSLDKRIEDLKNRIAIKRNKLSEQMGGNVIAGANMINNQKNNFIQDFNSILINNQLQHHQQQLQQHLNQQNQHPPQYQDHQYKQAQEQQQQILLQNDTKLMNKPSNQMDNQHNNNQNNINNNNSPTKIVPPKYATKQEIANTYMNKYGSDVLQKYRMLHQQQQHQHLQGAQALAEINQHNNNSNHVKQASNDETSIESETSTSSSHTNLPSSSSSLASLSPINNGTSNLTIKQSQQQNNETPSNMFQQHQQHQNLNKFDTSTLPSHLKLEFDKIKYLPDMVKTIKKRHSISEIEGSSNTLPPQIYQKILEKHHKNFLEQQNNSLNAQNTSTSITTTNLSPQKLNKITEEKTDFLKSFNSSGSDHLLSCESSNSPNVTITSNESKVQQKPSTNTSGNSNTSSFLSSFMPLPVKEQNYANMTNLQNEAMPELAETSFNVAQTGTISTVMTNTNKSTKSIIKLPLNVESAQTDLQTQNKRVNFDPHALLLDAAVEGELELVIKCAKQVKDVSEPNDEGITALHNSVCAGHFDIVKFLVEFGCDINYADNDGWTPLHCAASCNNIQMIKFLIENGASVFATTVSDNETAIRKCEEDEDGYHVCYEYLKNAQKNLGDPLCNKGIVYGLYSYEKQNDDELSFQCYEQLLVLNKHEDEDKDEANDGWWTCRSFIEKKEGLVPKNYLGVYPRVQHSTKNQESTIC